MLTTSVSLLQRLRQPTDDAAWEQFVHLYTPLLFFWARRLGLQESDAADLVQEVFTLLIRKLPSFTYDDGRSFRNWLRTVLRNKAIARMRGPNVLTTASQLPPTDVAAPDPAEVVSDEEFRQALALRALQLMQKEFQPTTWKACWEYLAVSRPAAEVAAELGITPNAVYLATSRVLRRLREEFVGILEL